MLDELLADLDAYLSTCGAPKPALYGTAALGQSKTVPVTPQSLRRHDFLDPELERRRTLELVWELFGNGPYSFLETDLNFKGHGVYTIHCLGGVYPYGELSCVESRTMLYTGSATQQSNPAALATRLREHRNTLQQVNLGLENFTFRFLCLEALSAKHFENKLVELFRPIWNVGVKGFGDKTGKTKGTRRSLRGRLGANLSLFDSFHPGRDMPGKPITENLDEIMQREVERSRRAYEQAANTVWPLEPARTHAGDVARFNRALKMADECCELV